MDDFEVRCGDLLYGSSSNYLVECFLGEGSFGKVAQCLKTATQEKVAVKIIKNHPYQIDDALQEITMLQRINVLDKNKCAIVRWSGWFKSGPRFCLEFELLRMSLRDFQNRGEFLTIHDICDVLHQLASALTLLKLFRVIHADLKPENIMMVHDLRPLKVKIIDFGLAHHTSEVQVGTNAGTRWYKAPELLLGLPYTGAIDVWALGCVAAEMFTEFTLYPGCSEYQMLKYISETQGLFPDHMLHSGIKTKLFFNKGWTLKSTDQYYRETGVRDVGNRVRHYNSLDELAEIEGGDEVQHFVDLLKWMLQLDAGLRITPGGIVKHPFITPRHGNTEHDNTSHCLFRRKSTEQSRLQQQKSCAETSSSSSNMSAPEVISSSSNMSAPEVILDHSEALTPAADVQKEVAGIRSKVKGLFVMLLLKSLCCCCCPTCDDV